MDGCSIPDGIIGYIGKIFKPDLYNKAKYLFYNICNTHDMYYHCGDNYNTCNTILLNNPDITCRNEYSYSQYEYSDYEDCMSDGKFIYNALHLFVNGYSLI